jgi:hypothetical protein
MCPVGQGLTAIELSQSRHFRLTDVHGSVVRAILA